MITTENIESLNRQLIDLFGIDTINGLPIWRIVFSDDQLEKRLTNFTATGIELLTPMVVEVPKYKQWIHQKYLLERLVLVPDFQQNELSSQKISYESIFVFETKDGNYLPPRLDICKIVIDSIYAAQGKGSLGAKYNDPDEEPDAKKKRVDSICEYLYGDESSVSDAFAHGEATTDFHQKTKES